MPVYRARIPKLVLGLGVLAVGVLFTLDNLGLVYARDLVIYWPLILIAVGVAQLFAGTRQMIACGSVFILAGAWILAYNLGYTDLEPWIFFWPVVLVLIGVNLVLGALGRRGEQDVDSDSFVNGFAIWSGLERQFDSPNFRGGDLTAIMGGCEIDLRRAKIQGEPPTLRVFAFWGGIDVIVPEEWKVDFRVFPFMGGAADETATPESSSAPTLVVKGMAIMGGVEFKN